MTRDDRGDRRREPLRVLVHGRGDGAWNMAVDEALLEDEAAGFTLRFYGWRRPTVSIGYAQTLALAVDVQRARRCGVGIVRRPTGGRAVLHADELTYALVGPVDAPVFAGGVSTSYRRIAAGLQAGLEGLGIAVHVARSGVAPAPSHKGACFGARTRHEIVSGARKLVGSAQRRRHGRLLQHGSLLLGAPDAALWAALGAGYREAMAASIGLDEVAAARPSRRLLIACLRDGIAAELGLHPRHAALSTRQRRAARRALQRYRSAAWTARK